MFAVWRHDRDSEVYGRVGNLRQKDAEWYSPKTMSSVKQTHTMTDKTTDEMPSLLASNNHSPNDKIQRGSATCITVGGEMINAGDWVE